ncbi:MAG: ABC transporter permease subunit [Treponema sp.]|jgi:ABC-type polysaccharide transport system permease subunit|nr:ABC transporter permease subunit [Treponema sp.]
MVIIFNYVPIFGWIYAFINYKPGVPIAQSQFVGLKYFIRVFSGASDFWSVLKNTLGISFLHIIFSVVPVILAIMISQVPFRGFSRTVQTFSSIPNFISWVLVYSVIFYLVASEDSALNKILLSIGAINKPVSMLTDVKAAWYVQVGIALWKSSGYNAIIYLAAISGIDQELYQAADVDGANGLQKIWHITIPGILSTYFVLLLLAVANMLSNGFEQFWLFGNSLTWDALEVFDTYVYRMGIQNVEFSFAITLGIFKTIVSVILLTIANTASKVIRSESIF